MHIAGTPAKINAWYSVNESWRMSTRQWKKADVVPWRGIALHDTRRTWDDTSPDTTVSTLQCRYLCVIPSKYGAKRSRHLKAWSLRMCITLFHTWLDNSSDPSSAARWWSAVREGGGEHTGTSENLASSCLTSNERNSEACGLIDEPDAYNSSKWPRNLAMKLAAPTVTVRYRWNEHGSWVTPVTTAQVHGVQPYWQTINVPLV